MELDLQHSSVEQFLALLARRRVKVPSAQGQGTHMHLALGATLQRFATLFRDDDRVLGVAATEVDTHVVGGPGPAWTVRHRAQVLRHAVLPAFLWGGPWHGFAVGHRRVGRGKGREANGGECRGSVLGERGARS